MGRMLVPVEEDFPGVADVVVIGGGIVGVTTAFAASKAGLDTVVLERRKGLGTLTTAASEECFRAQFSEPENVAMMLASIAVFENFAEVVGIPDIDIGIHQQGYLFLSDAPNGPEKLKAQVAHQQVIGLEDVEFLDGDEARRRFPWLGPGVTAATFRGRDGWLSGHELTYGFARGSDASFLLSTEALDIVVDGDRVSAVETNRGCISTPRVVVAAGPFGGIVARMAGVELPLSIVRRQKAILAPHALIPQDAPMTVDLESGAYWRPEVGGAALGWAHPEDPGVPLERVPTDWMFPMLVLEKVARLSPFWWDIAEGLRRESVHLSAGQYTNTFDKKPVIGEHPDVGGLYLNLGYSGHGIMGSPDGGRRLADLMTGKASEDQNPFGFERFARGVVLASEEKMVI